MAIAIANGGQEEVFLQEGVPGCSNAGQNQKSTNQESPSGPDTASNAAIRVFMHDSSSGQNPNSTIQESPSGANNASEEGVFIGPDTSNAGQEEDFMQDQVDFDEEAVEQTRPAGKKIKIDEDEDDALTQGVNSNVTDAYELFLLREQQLAAARMRACVFV